MSNKQKIPTNSFLADVEKIAPEIWFFLHQKLDSLSQSSIKFPEALDKKEIFDFFNQTSKYTFIALDKLSDEDKSKLAENKICLKSLQSMFTDSGENEQNLIQNFSGFEKHQITKHSTGLIRPFQNSIVETNYVYSICPERKTILRSNLSFFIQLQSWPYIFYRFEGKSTFYLITGAWTGSKIAIYYPISELVIKVVNTLQGNSKTIEALLNKLKGKIVYEWKKYYYYCVNNNPKELANIIHYTRHLGHTFYADYAGLQYLQSNQFLNNINKLFVGEYNLVKIEKLFSELDKSQIIYSNSEDLFSKSLTENSFLVRSTSFFMSDELVTRFKNYASSSCSSNVKEESSVLTNCYPVVWINIRVNSRVWISQGVGLARVIKKLQQKHAKTAVIFDGWTSLEATGLSSLSSQEKAFIEKELAIVDKIKSLEPNVIYKSVIGTTVADKLEWLKLADFYIIPYGSAHAFAYLYQIPGIVYSSRPHAANNKIQKQATSAHQSLVSPIVVSAEKSQIDENLIGSITDNSALAKMGAYNEDFECDADKIYEECMSIIRER